MQCKVDVWIIHLIIYHTFELCWYCANICGIIAKQPFCCAIFCDKTLTFVHSLVQSSLVVEVPPYHSKTVTSAVQVQFYVCNGKRKRSQSQRFTYLSGNRFARWKLSTECCHLSWALTTIKSGSQTHTHPSPVVFAFLHRTVMLIRFSCWSAAVESPQPIA